MMHMYPVLIPMIKQTGHDYVMDCTCIRFKLTIYGLK